MTTTPNNTKGISVIEILVAIAVLLVAFVGILGLLSFSLQVSTLIKETTQANFLAQDTIEAVRNFRDGTVWEDTDGLGDLNVDTSYYPEKTSDTPPEWAMTQGEETINGFTRKIVFESVERDAISDDIVESGVYDPNTKKAVITIAWKNKKVEIVTYFTNWK